MAATTATSLAESQSNADSVASMSQKVLSTKSDENYVSTSRKVDSNTTADASKKTNVAERKGKDTGDRGWNKVKTKSEKYENRFNNHGQISDGGERYRGFPRRRPPFRGYPRRINRTKEPLRPSNNREPNTNSSNAEVNGGIVDSHSSGESADSDARKSDNESKTKPEYVAAPIPKTNAWGKTNVPKSEKVDANPPKTQAVVEKNLEKTTPVSAVKTQHLPTSSAWGKLNKVEVEKEEKTDQAKDQTSGIVIAYFCSGMITNYWCTSCLISPPKFQVFS